MTARRNAATNPAGNARTNGATNADPIPQSGTGIDPITKIGTEVFGLRVISGYVHHADPDSIFLRQLYPGRPANIGRIEATGSDTGTLTITPARAGEWTAHERSALAAFFLTRYTDRCSAYPAIHSTSHSTARSTTHSTTAPPTSPTSAPTSPEATDDRAA